MKQSLILILFPFFLFSQEKSKNIYNNETVYITSNKGISVESIVEQKKLIVKSKNIADYTERIQFNNFNVISNLKGKTTILSKDNSYSIGSINTYDSQNESVFHSDNKFKYFVFPRVEDNSTVEFSYENKYLEPKLLSFFRFQDILKTDISTLKIVCDTDIEIGFKLFGNNQDKISFNKIVENKTITYIWKMNDIEAFEFENNMQNINYHAPHLVYYIKNYIQKGVKTELLNNKQNLYNWYSSLTKNCNINDLSEVKSKTLELIAGKKTDFEKAESIFNWLQQNMNYVAFEFEMGGFIPRDASDIYKKKYGDCKDMANLLNQMLLAANLKSNLTWIGTRDKPYSYDDFATPLVDNHMITSLKLDNKIYFLDATDKFCQFPNPSAMIQGKEALIGKSDSEFEILKVPIVNPENNKTKIKLDLKLNEKNIQGEGKVEISGLTKTEILSFITNYSNKEKEIWNNSIAISNDKIVLETVSNIRNNYNQEPAQAKFNISIQDWSKIIQENIIFKPILLFPLKEETIDTQKRKFAISKNQTETFEIEYNYVIPETYKIDFIPSNLKLDNELLSIEISYKNNNNSIKILQKIISKSLVIKNENFEVWNNTINSLLKQYNQSIILKK